MKRFAPTDSAWMYILVRFTYPAAYPIVIPAKPVRSKTLHYYNIITWNSGLYGQLLKPFFNRLTPHKFINFYLLLTVLINLASIGWMVD